MKTDKTTKKIIAENLKRNKDNLYSPEGIDYSLDSIRTEAFRSYLAKGLSLLPHEVIDYIIENFVFSCQDKKQTGECIFFDAYDLKNKKGLIILYPELYNKKDIEINFTIAHETAHAYLGHNQTKHEDTDIKISGKKEVMADNTAIKWLSKYYKKSDLEKCCSYKNNRKLIKIFK